MRTPVELRRRRFVVATIFLTLGVGAAGFAAGSRLRSPADKELESAPPNLGVLTVPVEFRQIGVEVLVRGASIEERVVSVDLPTALVDGGIVTDLPTVGDLVKAGDIPLEVSGRPLFVLPGVEPLYRDLTGGTEGRDVAALQSALSAVGLYSGEEDSVYGPETAVAVERLYERAGYSPPLSHIGRLEIEDAEANLVDAKAALDGAKRQRSLGGAEHADLVAAANRLVTEASASLTDARNLADNQIEAAIAETEAAQSSYDLAVKALEEATPEAQAQAAQDVADSEAHLSATQANQAAVEAEANEVVRQAELELESARANLGASKRASQSLTELDTAVMAAERNLRQATSILEQLRLEALTPFPVAEVILVKGLPTRVAAVSVELGEALDGPAVRLAPSANLALLVIVPRDIARRMEVGMKATFRIEGATDASSTVTWVAPQVGAEPARTRFGGDVAVPDGQVAVELAPDLPLSGKSDIPVEARIELGGTTEPTLVVPLAAVRTDADGSTWVAVLVGNEFRRAGVTVGRVFDGAASVASEDLVEGDKVVLGDT